MSGSIESIAASLKSLAEDIPTLTKALATAGVNVGTASPAPADDNVVPIPDTTTTDDKPASKKRASKKRASKAKPDDHSDIQLYKRKLVDVADASGVDGVMKKLKEFLGECGYEASDEIEVEDRAEFLTKVKDHFDELASGGESGDEDGLDNL